MTHYPVLDTIQDMDDLATLLTDIVWNWNGEGTPTECKNFHKWGKTNIHVQFDNEYEELRKVFEEVLDESVFLYNDVALEADKSSNVTTSDHICPSCKQECYQYTYSAEFGELVCTSCKRGWEGNNEDTRRDSQQSHTQQAQDPTRVSSTRSWADYPKGTEQAT